MSETNDSVTLQLEKSMTLANTESFYHEVMKVVEGGMPENISIDCVCNEIIDISILQILSALQKKVATSDCKLKWDNPSISLFELSSEVGLDVID